METVAATLDWIFYFAALGAFAGLLAGLFGVGGGAVMVPLLMFAFSGMDIDPQRIAHLAVGTSFACIACTSLGSVWEHHRKQNIRWSLWRIMAPTLAVGVTVGSLIASNLSSALLTPVIGAFFILVALQMALDLMPTPRHQEASAPQASVAGFGIGAVSSFIGIGGGTMTVPWLQFCGYRIHEAVGTSAACGIPIAVFGALSYAYFGYDTQLGVGDGSVSGQIGYVYLPAFLGIVFASVPAAMLGAKLASRFSAKILSRSFALLLFCVGSYVVFSSF